MGHMLAVKLASANEETNKKEDFVPAACVG